MVEPLVTFTNRNIVDILLKFWRNTAKSLRNAVKILALTPGISFPVSLTMCVGGKRWSSLWRLLPVLLSIVGAPILNLELKFN